MLGYTYTAVPAPIRSTRTEMGMGHTHSAQRLHESHMHEKHMHNVGVQRNSPANFTWIGSWNSLSSHIVHAIKATGNGFTGDGWTANAMNKLRFRGYFFSYWTSTKLISVLEVHRQAESVSRMLN